MKITRYSLDYESCNLEYDPEGDIVDYGDHCAVVCALQSRLESLEKDCEKLIDERDEREDVINELLNQVLCDERKEWSSAYDFIDAVIDVECKMKSLEKDAARWRFIRDSDQAELGEGTYKYKPYITDYCPHDYYAPHNIAGDAADECADAAMQLQGNTND